MRISDWSSDVCSSDLRGAGVQDLRSEACAGGLTPRRRGAGGEDMLGAMQDFELRVPRLLDHAAREHAHREIVTRWADGRESRTDWAGVASDARKLAQALERLGCKPGDRIAKTAMIPGTHLAAWTIGRANERKPVTNAQT